MQLKFKKLHPSAQLPIYGTREAAGMDLYACLDEAVVLQPGEAAAVPTGLAVELPLGMEAQIRGRSGLAFKHAIFSFNGTIDSDYRGEIKGLLINHSRVPFVIEPGMRICQMVINASYVMCRPEFVEEINETERGEKGFGSTGDGAYLNSVAHPDNGGISEEALETLEYDDGEGDLVPDHVSAMAAYARPTPSRDEIMADLLLASKGKK